MRDKCRQRQDRPQPSPRPVDHLKKKLFITQNYPLFLKITESFKMLQNRIRNRIHLHLR